MVKKKVFFMFVFQRKATSFVTRQDLQIHQCWPSNLQKHFSWHTGGKKIIVPKNPDSILKKSFSSPWKPPLTKQHQWMHCLTTRKKAAMVISPTDSSKLFGSLSNPYWQTACVPIYGQSVVLLIHLQAPHKILWKLTSSRYTRPCLRSAFLQRNTTALCDASPDSLLTEAPVGWSDVTAS